MENDCVVHVESVCGKKYAISRCVPLFVDDNSYSCVDCHPYSLKLVDSRKRNNRQRYSTMSLYNSISDDESERPAPCRDKRDSLQSPTNMRACLIQELVATQSVFASDMQSLQAAFLCVAVPIQNEDRYAVLGNLSEVVEVSRDLDRCWSQEMLKFASRNCDQVNIAKATLPFKNRLYSAFSVYSTNYNPHNLNKNYIIESFVQKGFQMLLKSNPSLLNAESMLIKPVQRLFKYQQLFEKLREETNPDHEDFEATCELTDYFCKLLREVNETKRWNEILGDVFKDHSRGRIDNGIKFIGHIFRNLQPSRITHTEPKLAEEKWKLENLQIMSKAYQTWIIKRLEMLDAIFVSERSFLQTMQILCTAPGYLLIHSKIRPSTNACTLSLSHLNAHATILDSIRSYLLLTVKPELDFNVVRRLRTLTEFLQDPQLLLEELERTDQRLTDFKSRREQAAIRNKSTLVLDEEIENLKRTRDTILENLLTQLPILTKAAEKVLFSAVAYGMKLTERFMTDYKTALLKQIQKLKVSSVLDSNMSSTRLMEYANEVSDWIHAKKHLRVSTCSSQDSPSPSATKQCDGVTARQLEIFKQNIQLHTTSVCDLLVPMSKGGSIGVVRAHSDVTGRNRPPYSIGFNHPMSKACSISTSDLSPPDCNSPRTMGATHQAGFPYEARNCHQVSLQKGQLVIMLQEHDAAGNREWCQVQVLPDETIGFVPASHLKPI